MHTLLFLGLFFLSLTASAQTESIVPFKGANSLVVMTPDSGHVALRQFLESMQAHGALIDISKKESLRFQTRPMALARTSKGATATYMVVASSGPNSQITVTGQVATTGQTTRQLVPASFTGGEKGAPLVAFRFMEGAAKAYTTGYHREKTRLRYAKQP